MSEFERWIEFSPAHDCILRQPCKFGSAACRPGEGGSHGRGAVTMHWYLRGERGVAQFMVFTGWHLPETAAKLNEPPMRLSPVTGRTWNPMEPNPADVGYHSPRPLHGGEIRREDCRILDGPCYYDGSGLAADEPFRLLVEHGSDAVWDFLADYYHQTCVAGEGVS